MSNFKNELFPMNTEIQRLLLCLNSEWFDENEKLNFAREIERIQVNEVRKLRSVK